MVMTYKSPLELKNKLEDIHELTVDNFFLVLNICACSLIREGYEHLLDSCLELFKKTKSIDVVRDCLYYFEEMFCIEDSHELNNIAVIRLRTRVLAMIVFLNWNRARGKLIPKKKETKGDIILTYENCMKEYDENPSAYGREEENRGSYWCKSPYPEWP